MMKTPQEIADQIMPPEDDFYTPEKWSEHLEGYDEHYIRGAIREGVEADRAQRPETRTEWAVEIRYSEDGVPRYYEMESQAAAEQWFPPFGHRRVWSFNPVKREAEPWAQYGYDRWAERNDEGRPE